MQQIIDGTIITKRTRALFSGKKEEGWLDDEGQRLSPASIAKTYLFLHQVKSSPCLEAEDEEKEERDREARKLTIIRTPKLETANEGLLDVGDGFEA